MSAAQKTLITSRFGEYTFHQSEQVFQILQRNCKVNDDSLQEYWRTSFFVRAAPHFSLITEKKLICLK